MKKNYLFFLLLIAITTTSFGQYVNMVINAADSTAGSSIRQLVALDGTLVYRANARFTGYWSSETYFKKYTEKEVWISDGTESGTSMIDVNADVTAVTDFYGETHDKYESSTMSNIVKFNDNAYFNANGGADVGTGTYKADASGNIVRIADWTMINPVVDDNKIYYSVSNAIVSWDGVNTPDTLPYQTDYINTINTFGKLGDNFILTADLLNDDPDVGTEIFLYDPTNADGPQLLLDVVPGDGTSYPGNYVVAGDKLFFTSGVFSWVTWAMDYTLYETDGTVSGTIEVAAVNSVIDGTSLGLMDELNGKLLLSASFDGEANNAIIYSYDPVTESLTTLSDVPGSGAASIHNFFNTDNTLDGWVYYGGGHLPAGAIYPDRFLSRTNGSVVELLDTVASAVSELVIYNDKVYFEAVLPGVSELSDGTLGSSGYELMVYDPNTLLSNNAFLADITIPDTTISGFDTYKIKYEVSLTSGNLKVPQINAVAVDAANATVDITHATTIPGITTIVVTAQDGSTLTYTVEFKTLSSLSGLTVNGEEVTGFNPGTIRYTVEYPYGFPGDSIPKVEGIAAEEGATVVVTDATSIPGTTTVAVIAEGGATTIYIVEFTIADPATVSTLSDLTMNDVTIDGFDAATLTYNVVLPYGHDPATIPVVVGTATDTNATVIVTDPAAIPGDAIVTVIAEDGINYTDYTVVFTIEPSTVSTLSDLTIDGVGVEGFDAATLTYNVELPYGHDPATIPVVVGTATDVNATVVVTDPAAIPGTTTVVVTAEDGSTTSTYTIEFTIAPTAVNDLVNNSNFNVYPTVSDKHFNIELGQEGGSVKVFNMLGMMVLNKKFYNSEAQINIEQNGMYLMIISNGTKEASFKIVKN